MKGQGVMRRVGAWAVLVVVLCAGTIPAYAGQEQSGVYKAKLSGAQEVLAVDTRAHGKLILNFDPSMESAAATLIVANIENVIGAHLHLAPAGVNGPVVVPLHAGLLMGRVNGVLTQITISDSSLTGPMAGMTLEDLRDAIEAGHIYVNVHTTEHPPGAIRGQVE